MSDRFDPTRRTLFGLIASLPAGEAIAAAIATDIVSPAAAAQDHRQASSASGPNRSDSGMASVRDFGAVGDGRTDDSDAFQAAIDMEKYIFVPAGQYRFHKTVRLKNGQRLFGVGKSAWEPYTERGFPDVSRSEIVVDGMLAFNAAGTNSASLTGLAIKATGGRQSVWGYPAGKQPGAVGVDITGSSQFEMRDVSFHGLEVAVDSNQVAGSSDTQVPTFVDWMASDCGTVFRFGNAQSRTYTVRDARIADCAATIHCDRVVDAHRCDGLRLENLRLFHGNGTSIFIRDAPFVSLNAVTVFETSEDQVLLKDCAYASLSGLLLARAGGYKGEAPYPQKVALSLDGCSDVRIDAQIQQPTGKAIDIVRCSNIGIGGSIGTPFWMTGNQNNDDGAIRVSASRSVTINAAFGGVGRDYWVSVWSDASSAQTLAGTVSSDRSIGVVRAVPLQQQGGYRFGVSADLRLLPGGRQPFATIRLLIPAGKVVKLRSVEIDCRSAQLCAVSSRDAKLTVWEARDDKLLDQDELTAIGSISTADLVLYDNRAGRSGWYSIELSIRNPTANTLLVPANTEIRLSTAVI